MYRKSSVSLFVAILLAMALTLAAVPHSLSAQEGETVTLRVGGKCAANPHMMPFWVFMEQTGGEFDNVKIEYVPVTGPPQMMALSVNEQIDVSFSFIFQGVKFFVEGGAVNWRAHTMSLWRAFGLITEPGVESWDDLVGEKVLLPQPGSGGDILTRLSMTNAGYEPDEDFVIEYMPPAQMSMLLVAGEAKAATVSEPQITILISKAKKDDVELIRSPIDLLANVYESDLWENSLLPLGAVMVRQPILDDPGSAEAFEMFVDLYHDAAAFASENPEEAAQMIVKQVGDHCDSNMQAGPVQKALETGFLVYDPMPVSAIMPDFADYVNTLYGEDVDETFYVPAAE
jgi:ABC-type nitrate/sulfonate/bicarbonate transport system substrate-binding protein